MSLSHTIPLLRGGLLQSTSLSLSQCSSLSLSSLLLHTRRNVATKSNGEERHGHSHAHGVCGHSHHLRLVLMGAPGSGKGTMASRITRDFGTRALSTGDMLRNEISNGSPVGLLAKDVIAKGQLVPDDIMIELVKGVLSKIRHENWLMDGFPRTLKQAHKFDSLLEELSEPLTAVINLDVPQEVILSRILDRWVHVPSGRVYNLNYNPPKVPGIDDITGEQLTKREDDNAETVRQRLQSYRDNTLPLLEHYDRDGLLMNFKGETSDIIYPKIQSALLMLQGGLHSH